MNRVPHSILMTSISIAEQVALVSTTVDLPHTRIVRKRLPALTAYGSELPQWRVFLKENFMRALITIRRRGRVIVEFANGLENLPKTILGQISIKQYAANCVK